MISCLTFFLKFMLCRKKKNATIPKYFWGAGEQLYGIEENIFGEPSIIFREQGSTDLPWGPL